MLQSCPTLCDPVDCSPPGSPIPGTPGKNTGVGCHFLLQGIFLIQGLNPGIPHCRQVLYQLNYQGSPLQCSCLENPRDGGAWWAAVYGVTQSWTQLKQLSSSSNSSSCVSQRVVLYSRSSSVLFIVDQSEFSPALVYTRAGTRAGTYYNPSSCVWNPRVFADDA